LPDEETVEFFVSGQDDPTVSAKQVALIARCIECGDMWLPADKERWRAYLDTGDKLVFYCVDCAEREFGVGRT
jgi:hypothetical protein